MLVAEALAQTAKNSATPGTPLAHWLYPVCHDAEFASISKYITEIRLKPAANLIPNQFTLTGKLIKPAKRIG